MGTEEGHQYGGRYEVTGPIASGGMAEVFRAQDRLLGRSVALKILHPEYARDRVFIERFRREAQAAASLNDPRIVSVFDWGSDDGTYYLVMEYVEGKTLREIIHNEGPLTAERAAEVVSDVCSALEIAHQHGIVHRDIKPANIVVTKSGQTKVMDFGIARAASDAGQTVTQTGTVIGTANYLSPEQAQGMQVDARSDVYSTGVVLYELLTREVPFKAETAVAIAYKHVKEEPAPPSRLNPEVPAPLDAIVMKALAKNPDNRYQSAREMRNDLDRAIRGEAVHATPLLSPDQTVAMEMEGGTRVMPVATVAEGSRRRKALAYALIILMFLGILVALVSLLISFLSPSGPLIEVPDVTGLSYDDAERKLDAEGLTAVRSPDSDLFSETVPKDHVISQSPEDGHKVPQGTEVNLVVSLGPERIEVPDLTGKTLEEAEALLAESDLKLGTTSPAFSDTVEKGRIISQSPTSGTRVERGSSVDIEISSGQNTVRVPNVTNIDEQHARDLLEERGLIAVIAEVCNTSERNNLVLDQSPAPRQEVPEGSEVKLTVNRAPRVPNVVNKSEEQAKKDLEAAGFKVQVEYTGPSPVRDGTVRRQDPSAGTAGCKGDTVTITVT